MELTESGQVEPTLRALTVLDGLAARTVDHHVSAILAKIGVRTRWDAAASAADL